jgi:hypothetical protein
MRRWCRPSARRSMSPSQLKDETGDEGGESLHGRNPDHDPAVAPSSSMAPSVSSSPSCTVRRASASRRTLHLNGKVLYSFRIIPDRGSWLEVQFDTNDLLYVYLDRRKPPPQVPRHDLPPRSSATARTKTSSSSSTTVEKLKLSETQCRRRRAHHQGASSPTCLMETSPSRSAYEPLTKATITPDSRPRGEGRARSSTASQDDTHHQGAQEGPRPRTRRRRSRTSTAVSALATRRPSRTPAPCSSGSFSTRRSTTSAASVATRSTRSSPSMCR